MTVCIRATKTCCKCGRAMPFAEFPRDSIKKDGLSSYCRACNSAVAKAWHVAHREQYRERAKRYRATHRKECTERWNRCRLKNLEYYKLIHRVGETARRADGMPNRICAVCGTTENVHYHHPDYTKPLEVVPLCALHHKATHSQSTERIEG